MQTTAQASSRASAGSPPSPPPAAGRLSAAQSGPRAHLKQLLMHVYANEVASSRQCNAPNVLGLGCTGGAFWWRSERCGAGGCVRIHTSLTAEGWRAQGRLHFVGVLHFQFLKDFFYFWKFVSLAQQFCDISKTIPAFLAQNVSFWSSGGPILRWPQHFFSINMTTKLFSVALQAPVLFKWTNQQLQWPITSPESKIYVFIKSVCQTKVGQSIFKLC